MTNDSLSPAAQAVNDAAFGAYWSDEVEAPNDHNIIAAAALRALADQVVPAEKSPELMRGPLTAQRLAQRQHTRAEILAIAAELEGSNE